MNQSLIKTVILPIVIIVILGSIFFLESNRNTSTSGKNDVDSTIDVMIDDSNESASMRVEEKSKKYERAEEISTPDGFINIDDINVTDLIGKEVILIDFWTYSCINCQRTFPYLNDWNKKYKDKGLTMIGIHTPEFEFEKKYENVLEATKRFGLEFAVVLDNDYSTWRAYKNQYWPRKYLIDIDGYIVYDHIGEGGYEETELKIQELLLERNEVLGLDEDVRINLSNPEGVQSITAGSVASRETYLGASRNEFLTNGVKNTIGEQVFVRPVEVALNELYFSGTWDIQEEFAQNKSEGDVIILPFFATKVFFVANSDTPLSAQILIDGEPITKKMAGEDVKDGVVIFEEDRLYKLYDNEDDSPHIIEIIPQAGGLKGFAFTFG